MVYSPLSKIRKKKMLLLIEKHELIKSRENNRPRKQYFDIILITELSKEQHSNSPMEKTGDRHFKQLIKLHIPNNKTNQHHVPLDMMHLEFILLLL